MRKGKFAFLLLVAGLMLSHQSWGSSRLPLGNRAVLSAIAELPEGGGYGTDRPAVENLELSVGLVSEGRRPSQPGLSFCSSATYVALLAALKKMEIGGWLSLPPGAWESLSNVSLPDGTGPWGRWNANGIGAARLLRESGLGHSFADLEMALPGDFLKFFWSEEIGKNERGHLVVFLGLEKTPSGTAVRYWSANKPGGIGEKQTMLKSMHNMVFTRLQPSSTVSIPPADSVDDISARMLRESFDRETTLSYAGISAAEDYRLGSP